jgi:hypothetical protein
VCLTLGQKDPVKLYGLCHNNAGVCGEVKQENSTADIVYVLNVICPHLECVCKVSCACVRVV